MRKAMFYPQAHILICQFYEGSFPLFLQITLLYLCKNLVQTQLAIYYRSI